MILHSNPFFCCPVVSGDPYSESLPGSFTIILLPFQVQEPLHGLLRVSSLS